MRGVLDSFRMGLVARKTEQVIRGLELSAPAHTFFGGERGVRN